MPDDRRMNVSYPTNMQWNLHTHFILHASFFILSEKTLIFHYTVTVLIKYKDIIDMGGRLTSPSGLF